MKNRAIFIAIFLGLMIINPIFGLAAAPGAVKTGNTTASKGAEPPPLNLSEDYSLVFFNNSDYVTLTINVDSSACMHDTGLQSFSLPPGGSRSIHLQDSNHIGGCTNQLKSVKWAVSANDSQTGTVEFNHYDCSKIIGIMPIFCATTAAIRGWRTNIVSSSSLISSAYCDDRFCLNQAVKDKSDIPNITINTLNDKQSQKLVITKPENNSRHPAPYSFTPSGTGQPGAVVNYYLPSCTPAEECQLHTATVDSNGQWKGSNITLTSANDYTLIAAQLYNGMAINPPNGHAQSGFTLTDTRTTVSIVSPENNSWLPLGMNSILGMVNPLGNINQVQCYVDNQPNGPASGVNEAGGWDCHIIIQDAGKHTIVGKAVQPLPLETDIPRNYITGDPLTITSPAENDFLAGPVVLKGTMQQGATVYYRSDTCGSGQAIAKDNTWQSNPIGETGRCTFSVTQTWQELTDEAVNRTFTIAHRLNIIEPSQMVMAGTRYPISGTGEPGALVNISLGDGLYPIDQVVVSPQGTWSTTMLGPSSNVGQYSLTAHQQKSDIALGENEHTIVVTDNPPSSAKTLAPKLK